MKKKKILELKSNLPIHELFENRELRARSIKIKNNSQLKDQ